MRSGEHIVAGLPRLWTVVTFDEISLRSRNRENEEKEKEDEERRKDRCAKGAEVKASLVTFVPRTDSGS